MKIPYKPTSLPFARRRYRYIMIHDITCQFDGMMEFYKDTAKFQSGRLRANAFVMNGDYELNYHYIVEKIDDDVQTKLTPD